jgi:hypothetical protein
MASVGMIGGESSVKPLFQLNGGITYGRYYSGIGIGFDPYRFNSVPVFADWRVNFGKSRMIFVYGNGGYNFPAGDPVNENEFFKTSDKMKGGLYIDAGMGYSVALGGWHKISFSAGYSQKNISRVKGYLYPCGPSPCNEEVVRYSYSLGRIVTKLSWEMDWKK